MPFLNPHSGWLDWWEYNLRASAGRSNYEVVVYEDNSVEIGVLPNSFNTPTVQYKLHGRHQKASDGYGTISIHHIDKRTSTTDENFHDLNLVDFEDSILFEYFRVVRSPHWHHPNDMLYAAQSFGTASWNEYLDVYFVLSPFTQEVSASIRNMHNDLAQEYEAQDIAAVVEVSELLLNLDKLKFQRIEKEESYIPK